jgi:PIN domain nuclease of toxin-antitoxin system
VILLDTHILLWMSLDPGRLSKAATLAIQDARSKGLLCISDITLWEIALLARRGRIQISSTVDSFLQEVVVPVVVKPITAAIAGRAAQFPEKYPKDPADRLIGATSLIEKLPLITADESLRRFHELNTIW